MDLLSLFQALPYILLFLNWYFQLFDQAWLYILLLWLDPFFSHFLNIELGEFYPFISKAANLLVLGSDDYKRSVILNFSDEDEWDAVLYVGNARMEQGELTEFSGILEIGTPPYSRLSSMGRIRFKLSAFGELRTARRVWKDYCAKRDTAVYVVNACVVQGELNEFLRDAVVDVVNACMEQGELNEFLRILGIETPPYSRLSSMGRIRFNLSDFGELRTACRVWKDYCAKRDAIVYVVNACAVQFSEAREEINYLLSDKDLENVPFLIFCETLEPSSTSERELCILLGLTGRTTGKGRVQLAGNARPLELFVAKRSNRRQHQDAIKWLSQYINGH